MQKQKSPTGLEPRDGIMAANTLNGRNEPLTRFEVGQLRRGLIFNPLPNRKQRRAATRKADPLNNRKLTAGRRSERLRTHGRALNPKVAAEAFKNWLRTLTPRKRIIVELTR